MTDCSDASDTSPSSAGASRLSKRAWQLLAFTMLCAAAAFTIPPVAQSLDYHAFADQRRMLGVPNFMDVASNACFVLVGAAGLVVASGRRGTFGWWPERVPYAAFFLGIFLTGIGSAYYHLAPSNETLVWDRLPMTLAFAALVCAQVADRFGPRIGLALLGPAILVGAWTVVYWMQTERGGAGNVVPYAVLQGYTMVVLLAMVFLYPSRYTRGRDIAWVFAAYALAKVFELLDHEIFAMGGLLSGHTLKHVAGAAAALLVIRMLVLRSVDRVDRPVVGPDEEGAVDADRRR